MEKKKSRLAACGMNIFSQRREVAKVQGKGCFHAMPQALVRRTELRSVESNNGTPSTTINNGISIG